MKCPGAFFCLRRRVKFNGEKQFLQLLWVTGSSGKKRPFDISRDICHEQSAVRNEYVALPFPKTKGEVGVQSTLLHFATLLYSQRYHV